MADLQVTRLTFRQHLSLIIHTQLEKRKGKLSGGDLNKGGGRIGTAVKREIKEVQFRVVLVYPGTMTTPLDRSNRTKEVWIRADASVDEVCQRIREEMM